MRTIVNTKYIEVEFSLKSWGIGIDWDKNDVTRPYYIDLLCFCICLGQDPFPNAIGGYLHESV